uniref:Transcription initiation factor TFIID subunit 10-like n=1 Tax=Phallusia mammillata TaxID=59560 RepID=A0A6F9DTL1_9ASCI|nr:transcription initiation factor TFIID subunit 10-like [Phallusia mammillata]
MNGVKTEKDMSSEEDEETQLSDSQFVDLLQQLENYTPTIPDGVAEYYLNRSGVNTTDTRIVRLISLAAQKFMSDILNDALQLNKMKGSAQNARSSKTKEKKLLLTMDDLVPVLADRGIKVKKPAYYT